MIADLHCHYPMHLLPADKHPHGAVSNWLNGLADHVRADAIGIAAHLLNDPRLASGWRVDLDGLEKGGARIVCSVLYWPAGEFRLGTTPAGNAFEDLQGLLTRVQGDLAGLDPDNKRHVIVGPTQGIVADKVNFVHCVEGGFNLGPDRDKIDEYVKSLAEHGVLYVTIAHLFFQGVATNAPAIPLLTDSEYSRLFHQPPGVGLTDLGKALVESMYDHNVLVDISHMSEAAIRDTFDVIQSCDDDPGRPTRDYYPVLATHVGMRTANRDTQAYNLSEDTVKRIKARDGLIGLIMAQHQLGATDSATESRDTVKRHLDAIAAACGGFDNCAIGTDLDGFIKPTLTGVEKAEDLATLAEWIEEDFPEGRKIVYDNAARVIGKVLAARTPPPGDAST